MKPARSLAIEPCRRNRKDHSVQSDSIILRHPFAVALAVTFALCAPAKAINLAPNGAGEVLIFPYYTVRNGFDTLLSVSNTSDRTVLAIVRFREAKNGRPASEFQLALAPHDVWTGAVTSNGGNGAVVRTFDNSCTVPVMLAGPNGSTQVALSTAGFDGTRANYPYDNGGRELARVQEGFVEVIEMGISSYPGYPSVPDGSIQSRTSMSFPITFSNWRPWIAPASRG